MLCAVLCLVVSPKYIPLFKFAANTLLGILYYVVICREGVASSQFHFCRTLFLSHNCNSPLMPIFRYVAVQVRVTRFCHHIEASLFAIHFILLLLLPWYMSLWHFLLYFITRYYYQGRGQLFLSWRVQFVEQNEAYSKDTTGLVRTMRRWGCLYSWGHVQCLARGWGKIFGRFSRFDWFLWSRMPAIRNFSQNGKILFLAKVIAFSNRENT